MPEFKRIKVLATLESEVMLLTRDQVDQTVSELGAKLKATGLKVVSIEPEELVTDPAAVSVGYDD